MNAPLFGLNIQLEAGSGLEKPGQIVVDKIGAVRRDRVRRVIGKLDEDMMICVNRSLAFRPGMG